jgi:hypothetical protein
VLRSFSSKSRIRSVSQLHATRSRRRLEGLVQRAVCAVGRGASRGTHKKGPVSPSFAKRLYSGADVISNRRASLQAMGDALDGGPQRPPDSCPVLGFSPFGSRSDWAAGSDMGIPEITIDKEAVKCSSRCQPLLELGGHDPLVVDPGRRRRGEPDDRRSHDRDSSPAIAGLSRSLW